MIRSYYQLAKPGIVYGNVFTAVAGFLYASRWYIEPVVFLATMCGLALVIASAAVCNNYLDRDIDQHMERTRSRALVRGTISPRNALLYAAVLGSIGIYLLSAYVSALTASIALLGFVFYVLLYTHSKRISHWAAVVGSVSGAVSIVVGYTAVVGRIDTQAIILFLILALWQMPHFYSIATYRLNEYEAAKIPVLPAQKGIRATKIYILRYVVVFIMAQVALFVWGYAGYTYLALVSAAGLWWLVQAMQGFTTPHTEKWARRLFRISLLVLLVFSVALSVASITP